MSLVNILKEARKASYILANSKSKIKDALLQKIADKLRENRLDILEANKKDLSISKELVVNGELSQHYYNRLILDDGKIEQMAKNMEAVMLLPDPIGKTQMATQLNKGLDLYRVSVPIGVLLVIYESRPEVIIQVSALTLKSGNSVILKGGKESRYSNEILFSVIQSALQEYDDIPNSSVSIVYDRDDITQILNMPNYVDLIIPRGSRNLVKHIQSISKVPVLAHADGICHVYIHSRASMEKAQQIVLDSKLDNPSVCNSLETLLVDSSFADDLLHTILLGLCNLGVELRACKLTKARMGKFSDLNLIAATEDDWRTEYTNTILSVKTVGSTIEAIEHINTYGSRHTDAIVTEEIETAELFMGHVDSASVIWNASTRFADGYRYGFGAEIGISTNKIHARGPVGLEGLTIYKYKLYGQGQGISKYKNGSIESYLHRPLDIKE